MTINLQLILRHINVQKPVLSENDSSNGTLKNIFRFCSDAPCEEGYVYYLKGDEVQALKRQDASRRLAFIVMHSDNEEYPELPAKWDTLQFRASGSEELTFREIQKVFDIYNFWEKRLSDAVLEQVEIPKLMNTATDLFPNPIALFDPSFALIGHGGRIPENVEDPIWETVLGKKFASVKNLPHDFRQYYSSRRPTSALVCFPDFSVPSNNRILMAHLFREDNLFAILAMDELCASFQPCDLVILDVIRSRLELSERLFHYAGIGERSGSAAFRDMLDGKKTTAIQIEHMRQSQGWQDCKAYMILRIISNNRDDELSEGQSATFIRRLSSSEPGLSVYSFRDSLVALRQCDCRQTGKLGFSTKFLELVDSIGLIIGVSMVFSDFRHIHEAFLQAEAALACAGEDNIVYFNDVAVKRLRSVVEVNGSCDYFCHPAALHLKDNNKWELFRTLYLFLETGEQLSETARILGVHRNTVSYRLEAINDLCGINIVGLSDKDKWLIRFSYRLLTA